jgi:serine/threonine protein kinase
VAELASGVREGEILAHKYRIDRVLGAGAMGVVVAAHHLGLDTKVAIKLLQNELLDNEEAVARFAREARAAAKITNEHVARVLDVGVLETGAPFMVMEFLDGADLHQWLERHGPLPVEQAVDFVLQASEAIAEAHRLGIVHRDLKPSNLFCVPRADGTLSIKVLDFGISKMSVRTGAGSSVSMTRTATVIGTPLYMSPEQMESSRGVDARADVWALGVILFELLAGKSPFFAETLPEVCLKIATRPPTPLRELRADVPKEVEAAILRCLEKERDKRCQTVADFCAAIASFGPPRGAASAERVWRTMQAPARSETAMAADFRLDAYSPRRTPSLESIGAVGHTRTGLSRRQTGVVGALGAVIAVSVVVSAVFLTRLSGSPAQATPAPASALPVGRSAPTPTGLAPSPTLDRTITAIAGGWSKPEETTVDNTAETPARTLAVDAAAPMPAPARGHKAAPTSAGAARSAAQPQTPQANQHAPGPQAPAEAEAPKGSAYDERL